MDAGTSSRRPGRLTVACRALCVAAIVSPLLYRLLADPETGSAYVFLLLVLLAPVAGLVLFLNSLVCIFRYRNLQQFGTSLVFVTVAAIGFFIAAHFLPQFRM